ncbi:Hypothetical_protein [Hexamita inflata]|uniref:Hypothetical_protein n=1 Tax=Hexamita inflata TaxID=28002 RepID=A0ABP1GHC9_9EUKA
MDFSYTSGITRLSSNVPPYLRILPLKALHIFASTANINDTFWNSISGFSNLSDEGDNDGLSWLEPSSEHCHDEQFGFRHFVHPFYIYFHYYSTIHCSVPEKCSKFFTRSRNRF